MQIFRAIFFLLCFSVGIFSCSWRSIFVRTSDSLIKEVESSFLQESDPQLAKEAIPTLIKLSEGLFEFYPKSPYYSGKLCFLYAAYAFAFLDQGYFDEFSQSDQKNYERMINFYNRAFYWGVKTLQIRFPSTREFLKNPVMEEFPNILIKEKDVEFLFWFVLSWSMRIFYNTSDPILVAQLEGVQKVVKVLQQVPYNYLYGILYSIPMALHGGRSAALGGNLHQAENFYQKGVEHSGGRSLVFDYIRIKFVSTQFDDQKLFENSYKKIREFSIENSPKELILINTLIKQKAQNLFQNREEIFNFQNP